MLFPREPRRFRLAVPAVALMTLAGCASSDVSGIKVASEDQIKSIRVSEIEIVMETPKPHPSLESALRAQLEKAMPICATGQVDHSLLVTVTDFEEQDVGKAIFLGDEIELEGTAAFVDLATGQQTGAYYLENSFAWGGFIGAAMMSDAEESLSKGFAKNLCKEVFGVTLPKEEGS